MCGFAGFFGGDMGRGEGATQALLRSMGGSISHRGPDSAGQWWDRESGIGLAHARLAIIDLSPAGQQPMHSSSGRWVIAYNGEIYNHLELRRRLDEEGKGGAWRGHSDTETLLAAIEAWGIEAALGEAIGMFAFALWDRQERRLILARDRLGEKPLYYGWSGSGAARTFLFGSELKALRAHPAFAWEVDRDALALYMRYAYVPSPASIHVGISKLPPGSYLVLPASGGEPRIRRYWCGDAVARRGAAHPIDLSPAEAVDRLEALLLDAVGQQMIADVPLGAFLSGGVDSSTVVALMQARSSRPVRTFTIGFHEEGYNEAEHAKAVARHLGTDHEELYVTPAEAMAVIPRLPDMYDEPFADSSQIPTFLVSELARRHVTVSLSGDAGDELFGGYNRYGMAETFWRHLARLPRPLRAAAARGFTLLSPGTWNRVAGALRPVLPTALRFALPGDKIHKGASVLASRDMDSLYRQLVSTWRDPGELVIGGREPDPAPLELESLAGTERMMALDMMTYLPDDILAKVDRAAMCVSLETRVPLLDHRVVEYAWSLPTDYKIRGGQTKWALREVLYRYVPRALIERPKMGFGVPIDSWLRGPLRDWAEDLLDARRLREEGYFRPEPIRAVWEAHLGGNVNFQPRLWTVLMFQAWLAAREGAATPQPAPMPLARSA